MIIDRWILRNPNAAELKRLNTFHMTAVLDRTHDVHFSSTAPEKLRLHLRDVAEDEYVVVRVHYAGVPNRVDVYDAGSKVRVAASAAEVVSRAATAPTGTSFHELDTTTLTVLVKGSRPLDLIIAPVLQLDPIARRDVRPARDIVLVQAADDHRVWR